MLKINKILVPTDFSTNADFALNYALKVAHTLNAQEMHLVHVDLYGEVTNDDELMDKLKHVEKPADEVLPFTYRLIQGHIHAAPALSEYAAENGIDLIVMGTHGLRGMRRFLLGSVAEELVRTATCHVITLHENQKGSADIKRIVVPVDFSDHSRTALSQAKHLAAAYGASVDALYVIEEWYYPHIFGMQLPSLAETNPEMNEMAQKSIEKFYTETPGPDVEHTLSVHFGTIVNSIRGHAAEINADLVVIATHGVTSEWEELIGSVTEKLVRTSDVPMWTMRPVKGGDSNTWLGGTTAAHVA